jgi:hypothetical protein
MSANRFQALMSLHDTSHDYSQQQQQKKKKSQSSNETKPNQPTPAQRAKQSEKKKLQQAKKQSVKKGPVSDEGFVQVQTEKQDKGPKKLSKEEFLKEKQKKRFSYFKRSLSKNRIS